MTDSKKSISLREMGFHPTPPCTKLIHNGATPDNQDMPTYVQTMQDLRALSAKEREARCQAQQDRQKELCALKTKKDSGTT